eukprot:6199991-Pleurochrysis_carterae.AAC.1
MASRSESRSRAQARRARALLEANFNSGSSEGQRAASRARPPRALGRSAAMPRASAPCWPCTPPCRPSSSPTRATAPRGSRCSPPEISTRTQKL